jgi:predicted aspartyl protease
MGTFSVEVQVGGYNGGATADVVALVDTGSSYTVLGQDLLERLGIRPAERRQFQLGDDSLVEWDMGQLGVLLDGRWQVTPVVFGSPGVSPLLGAVTLQQFGLIADSVNERLIPMPPIRVRPL